MKLTEDPHRRLNALTNEWVLVSPNRATRPWQGEVAETPTAVEPSYDPACYLCPGNVRASGVRNPAYSDTFVFENDFAALRPEVVEQHLDIANRGLIVADTEPGICRVMCFSPFHNLTLSTMNLNQIELVVRGWIEQYRELSALQQIRHVQIFENRGAMMGASNPHPHCQIWATTSIPEVPFKEQLAQQLYWKSHTSCLLCDYLDLEDQQKARLVCQNDGFVALVPFWAVWPFEILVCSHGHLGNLLQFTADHIASLSQILKLITTTYDKVFSVPFPYSMGFHQTPMDDDEHPEWHFHAHFYPPLLRSATIRKFMVGFEMFGTPQRDITPEAAAEQLQGLSRS